MHVLLTIDTETFPITSGWREDGLAADMKRDLYGEIDGQAVGLEYQLKMFANHRLKANFMVESLFAAVPEVGPAPLKHIVQAISKAGHDIQVHPHPEWIQYANPLGISYKGHLLREYSLPEQERIIRFAKEELEEAGAATPVAFRAGGYAANSDTYIALARCGLKYDTSFNRCYQNTSRHQPTPKSYGHATDIDGIKQLPIAVFEDRPYHLRPAQICACSSAEMLFALDRAEREGWEFFVIVSHSFEMINRRRHPNKAPFICQEVVRRFENLCAFLANNRERFDTVRFSDMRLSPSDKSQRVIKGKLLNTANRMFEQAGRAAYARSGNTVDSYGADR